MEKTIEEFRVGLGLSSAVTNSHVVQEAYKVMSRNYRSEYYYKNLIADELFLRRHRGIDTTLLNEFRIGNSVADGVLINGQGVVYEIKTEFDTPSKLKSQIENYYKVFPYVNVVTHSNTARRYERELENSPAGLLSVDNQGIITIVKEPQFHSDNFDTTIMFNVLRLRELTDILINYYGPLPEVPNGIRYNAFLSLANEIPRVDFQKRMQDALKRRTLRSGNRLLANRTVLPLRSMVIQLDPTPDQSLRLSNWLDARVS